MAIQSTSDALAAPFILSLIAGLLILSMGGMMTFFWLGFPYYWGMMGNFAGGYSGMMQGYGLGGWFYGFVLVGVISGAVILLGAVMLYVRPSEARTWGLIILVFSILSLPAMGGFFVGAILGIVGGVLTISGKDTSPGA